MLKRCYIAADPVDAHMVRGELEANGIHAVVKGEYAWTARGETPLTDDTAPAVWVEESELEAARRFIESRHRDAGDDWKCPGCGERLEGQFTQCWHCGRVRHRGGENPA